MRVATASGAFVSHLPIRFVDDDKPISSQRPSRTLLFTHRPYVRSSPTSPQISTRVSATQPGVAPTEPGHGSHGQTSQAYYPPPLLPRAVLYETSLTQNADDSTGATHFLHL